PPTISAIPDADLIVGTPATAGFTVGDAETPAGQLTVTASSSNTGVVPNGNVTLGGSGANRTITVNAAAAGTADITVTVTDGGGFSASRTFHVTASNPASRP